MLRSFVAEILEAELGSVVYMACRLFQLKPTDGLKTHGLEALYTRIH